MTQRTVRVGGLDVMHSGARITALLGPVRLDRPDVIRQRLVAMAAAGPHTRVGLLPSNRSDRWSFDPTGSGIRVERRSAPTDPRELLDAGGPANTPVRVVVAGDYLVTDHDHGLGEVELGLAMHDVILAAVSPYGQRAWDSGARRNSGVIAAAFRTFGANPIQVLALVDSARRNDTGRDTDSAPSGDTLPWSPRRRGVVATMDAGTFGDLRTWRDRQHPECSVFALTTAALCRAVAATGIDVHPTVTIPFDGRRYLADGRVPLGNFVAGLQFPFGDRPAPESVHASLSGAATAGRPVANIALNSARARLAVATRSGPLHTPPSRVPAKPRANLLFSSMGRVHDRAFTGEPLYIAHSDPAGPEGITVSSSIVADRLQVVASFHGNVFPESAVRAALDRFVAKPVGLLSPHEHASNCPDFPPGHAFR